MSIRAKYHYTHFIYPFVIDNNKYGSFIENILSQDKSWKLNIDKKNGDEELHNFFLPYMRKFLFPTIFWNDEYIKSYKNMNNYAKVSVLKRLTCLTFDYELNNIKTGKLTDNRYEVINFDISNIKIICFEPGICFLDIKAQIDESTENIDFNKILDFNNIFRELTPKNNDKFSNIKAKSIDNIKDISIFINSVISGFESNDLEKIYYDKMFTYSYACINKEDWNKNTNFDNIKNDFYRFQYVIDSKNTATFNNNCNKLEENTYSRWQFSKFGFSRESGVVLVSEDEQYNITRMPYNFEKTYLYILLLAFFQRISLINFSQELLRKDKTMVQRLKKKLTKFTHFSWFSQITNSEHGMDIWKSWQKAFELQELYDEVHREYMEYYDFVVASGQDKTNLILIILYTVSVIFSGISIVAQQFDMKGTWIEPFIIYLIIFTSLSYPIYLILRWCKHKIEKMLGTKI
ncbi:MAG: hypothetical protein RSF67_07935 [Clostridia bacterium]